MIGTEFVKTPFDSAGYEVAATWCAANNARIEDMGDYYEVVADVPVAPTEAEIRKKLQDGVQRWLDEEARSYGYDSIDSTAKYMFCDDPKFKAEAIGFGRWAGAVWRECYRLIDEYFAGRFEIPTIDHLIEILPRLTIEYPEGVE